MKNKCENCLHVDTKGYRDYEHSKNVGFCKRFTEVVKLYDAECIGFCPSTEKEEYYRNLAKAKEKKIFDTLMQNSQTSLF